MPKWDRGRADGTDCADLASILLIDSFNVLRNIWQVQIVWISSGGDFREGSSQIRGREKPAKSAMSR
jgi:hypothetical protein